MGGAEHAVLHLLYARFWSKVLFDLGHVSSAEPFHKLFNQGMIQAYAYTDARGVYVPAAEVEERDGGYFYQGEPVKREHGKMGKSLKNAVTPDEICEEYGADTLRLYEMAMGPLDVSRPWDTRAVVGQYRLLQRLWRNIVDEETGAVTVVDAEPAEDTLRALHKAIDGAGADLAGLRFNTAIAKITELNNFLTKAYFYCWSARSPSGWCCSSPRWLRTSRRSCGTGWGTATRWSTRTSPSRTRRTWWTRA